MNDAFNNIVLILRQQLHPTIIFNQNDSRAYLEQQLKNLHPLINIGRIQLRESLISVNQRENSGQLVICQMNIVTALDVVHDYLAIKVTAAFKKVYTEVRMVYNKIMNELRMFMRFLLRHFKNNINLDLRLPRYQRDLIRPAVAKLLSSCNEIFNDRKLNNQLIRLCTKPLNKFIDNDQFISLRDYRYFKQFYQQLKLLVQRPALTNDQLIQFLISVRYNDELFFGFYIEHITGHVAELEEINKRILYYHYQVKMIRQRWDICRISYKHQLPEINERLCYWIQEEIAFLEKEEGILPAPLVEPTPPPGKLKLGLSVQEISLAIRLLMDAKIIVNDNFAEVVRLIVHTASSNKSQQISPESLRIKSYIFETSVVNKMKDKIIALMNLTRKY